MPAQFNHGSRVLSLGEQSRPIAIADISPIGAVITAPAADDDVFPLDEPVHFYTHEADKVAALGATGTGIQLVNAIRAQGIEASVVVVRVDPGADAEATRTAMVGSAANQTGVHALKYARGHVGIEPTLLVAPAFDGGRIGNAKNPVADALVSVAEKLKAVAVIDTGTASRAETLAYRADFSSRYAYLVDPYVRVLDGASIVSRPASPFAVSMFVKKDKEKGLPGWSPSNQEVLGILGTARPISYFDGEVDHEANLLNQAGVATFIPSRIVQGVGGAFSPNGRILWGNRTASEDPLWAFVNVVRIRAMIEKSIVNAFRPWAIDQNMTSQHVLAVMRSVQEFLDGLRAAGVILGGRVYWDRDANTNADLRSGRLRVEFDAEETPPLEDLIFGSHRNEAYFDSLASDIQRRVTREFTTTINDYLAA